MGMLGKNVRRVATISALFVSAMMLTANPSWAQVKWDFLVYQGLNAATTQIHVEFAKEVLQRTNGQLVITVRPPGEFPYNAADFHRVVGRGDVAMADTAYISSDVPGAGVLTSAFLVQNFDDLAKATKVTEPYITEGLNRFGAQVLFWWAFPPIKFFGAGKPVENLDGLKGLKIRTLTPEHQELLTGFGASPVAIAAPEVLTALQYGTANAAMTTAVGVVTSKWEGVMKWGYILNIAPTPSFVIVNSKAFAALPEEHRKILAELGPKYSKKLLDYVSGAEESDLKRLADKGMKVVNASPADTQRAQQLAQGLWANWVKARGESGEKIMKVVRDTLGR